MTDMATHDRATGDQPAGLSRALHATLTRRQLLAAGALAGTSAFLAACGTKGTGGGSATPEASGGATPEATTAAGGATPSTDVNWANWSYYIDLDPNDANRHPTLEGFTAKYGTVVQYAEVIEDNDSFYGTIKDALAAGKDTGWDIITPTDWMAARLIKLGWVDELNLENMPNFTANLKDSYKNIDWDPETKFHAPYRSFTTGIGYDVEALGEDITSLQSIFTPDERWNGKVEFLSEMRDAVGLTMLSLGLDPATPTREGCDKAIARMQQAKEDGILRSVKGGSYAEDLKNGDAVLCMAWGGDMIQAQIDNANLRFSLPTEGGMIFSDHMLIPKGAAHKGTAELLIDYFYDPDVAAEITHATYYPAPVNGSDEILAQKYPDDAKNPLIVPPADWVARLHPFGPLETEDEQYFNEQFAKVLGVG